MKLLFIFLEILFNLQKILGKIVLTLERERKKMNKVCNVVKCEGKHKRFKVAMYQILAKIARLGPKELKFFTRKYRRFSLVGGMVLIQDGSSEHVAQV